LFYRLSEVNEELAIADQHIDELESTVSRMETEKVYMEERLSDYKEIVDSSKTAAEIAANFHAEMEKDYSIEIEEIKLAHGKEIAKCDAIISRLELEVRQQNAEKESMLARLKESNEKIAEKDANIKALDKKRNELVNFYDSSTKVAAELREELAAVRSKADVAERNAQQHERELKTISSESTTLNAQIEWQKKEKEVCDLIFFVI
jgi:chromosome segregation ATPase